MTETPWLDCMDGFKYSQEPYPDEMFEEAERREAANKKVLKSQRQAQKLLDAAHRVADGEVPLGKLIRLGHKDPMSVRVRYEYGAILLALVEECAYMKDGLTLVNVRDILDIIEVLNNE
jgi:hypothetical protein